MAVSSITELIIIFSLFIFIINNSGDGYTSMKNIKCKILKKDYQLTPMVSEEEKAQGLTRYPIGRERDGLIFLYDTDMDRGFTFAKIPHSCIIYFLDSNLKVLNKSQTAPFQQEIVKCPQKYRYVIEISA